jgi:hypothetical protein
MEPIPATSRFVSAAGDHVLDDDGPGPAAGRALDERATRRPRFGADVGQREVEPLGQGLGPGNPGVPDGDDAAGAGKPYPGRVGQSVIDQPPEGRDSVEQPAVAPARGPDPGLPAEPLINRLPQVGGEGPRRDQRVGHRPGVPGVEQAC